MAEGVSIARRDAFEGAGRWAGRFFYSHEGVELTWRTWDAGWEVWFCPEAECVHVGAASHGGRLFRESVRGHLRYLAKHAGEREAERARRLLRAARWLRGLVFRGERGRQYRELGRWLASGRVPDLLRR